MKVMISQPMGGKSETEIHVVRDQAARKLESMGYTVINTIFGDVDNNAGEVNAPLYYLGKSMEFMSMCDAVYFCDGWENYRGCLIEHGAAKAYGLKILYEGLDDCDER